MNELSDKQLKEIQEACLSSYQRGYREGYTDACKQIKGMVDTLSNSAEEALQSLQKRATHD